MRNRRHLDRRVRDLADCAMFDVGLRQLVGVKVERLRHQRDREKTETSPHCPAPGWSQVCRINGPDFHRLASDG